MNIMLKMKVIKKMQTKVSCRLLCDICIFVHLPLLKPFDVHCIHHLPAKQTFLDMESCHATVKDVIFKYTVFPHKIKRGAKEPLLSYMKFRRNKL